MRDEDLDSNTPAYNPISGRKYDSWDDLVNTEAIGYVVIFTSTRPHTEAVVYGPFTPSEYGDWDKAKAAANTTRARLRPKYVRIEKQYGEPGIIQSRVRLLWKDMS